MEWIIDFLKKGGPIMWPLILCSIVSLAITIERIFFWFGQNRRRSKDTIKQIFLLTERGQFKQATKLAMSTYDVTVRMLLAGLKNKAYGLKENMEASAADLIDRMKRGLKILNTIITMSPLLGILGTVIGIIESFNILGIQGIGNPKDVIGGMAQALITTAVGLSIALITLVPYNYFIHRVQKTAKNIEQTGTLFETACKKGLENESKNRA